MVLGPQPPGSLSLTDELARLEQRINNGIKSAGPNHVLCVTRLASDVAVPANTDTRPVTQWNATAETDARGMYHYNDTGDTWWQIPFKGYWRVLVHSRWSAAGTGTPVSTSVLLNGTSVATTGIGESTAFNVPNGSCCYNTIVEDRILTTGDQVRVNFWSYLGGTVKATTLAAYTHVKITYLGTE